MVSGRRASGMKNSSGNVQQTFQFADDLLMRRWRRHQQTGKFAVHRAPRFSQFHDFVTDDMDGSSTNPV
jgi:hypothetical protein